MARRLAMPGPGGELKDLADTIDGLLARLQAAFQRRSGSRFAGTEGLGLGLGLSIVAAITEAHHGSLTINPGSHGGLDIDISFPATAAIPPARDRALAAT
jgi:signal transduction histidine kinase